MKVTVIPIAIDFLRTIYVGLLNVLEDLEIRGRLETIKTTKISKIVKNSGMSLGDLRKLAYSDFREIPSTNVGM